MAFGTGSLFFENVYLVKIVKKRVPRPKCHPPCPGNYALELRTVLRTELRTVLRTGTAVTLLQVCEFIGNYQAAEA